MAQLAKHHDGQTITRLEEIAQREAVSANFLVQILNDLRRSSLIVSKRGKMGGYQLAKTPDNITLYDIVSSVEPTILSKTVSSEGESGSSIAKSWETVGETLSIALKEVTLESMAETSDGSMFYI